LFLANPISEQLVLQPPALHVLSCKLPLQDLFGGGLLSQVSAAVNFTQQFPDVPSPEIFSLTDNFTLNLLELDLELDLEDVAGICGCIRTVAALSMGQGIVHAGADAAQLPCSSSSSSGAVAPMQLYSWAHSYAKAAAAGRFDGKQQAKAAAEGTAATSAPSSSSSSSAGRVIAAAANGGLVAYCCPQQQQQQQQGWGVYLPPGAPDAPLLHSVTTRVLPVAAAGSSSSIVLHLQCQNINLQQHTLLIKCGRQLHSLPLLPAAAAAGCCAVEIPGVLLQQPGVMLLSLATQQHFVSGSQAVLLLPCQQAVADELNEM
jgi:hypothetical protein